MKQRVWAAPLAAVVSAFTSLACCLPLALLGALGTASASGFFAFLRPWLLGLSAVLLALGFFQLYRRGPMCQAKHSERDPVLDCSGDGAGHDALSASGGCIAG